MNITDAVDRISKGFNEMAHARNYYGVNSDSCVFPFPLRVMAIVAFRFFGLYLKEDYAARPILSLIG